MFTPKLTSAFGAWLLRPPQTAGAVLGRSFGAQAPMCAPHDSDDGVRFRRAEQPTLHLFIGGSAAQLESALPGEQYSLQRLAGRLFASFVSVEAAQRAHEALSSAGVFNGYSEFLYPSTAPAAAEAEAELEVPAVLEAAGLRLHRDFVTEEEEARVLEAIDAAPWDCSIHRRVQHYGERFDYTTKTVSRARPPPLPPWMSPVLEAVRDGRSVPWAEEAAADGRVQVTVNEYTPGVGIASHVDTHSAFEDGLAPHAESAVLAAPQLAIPAAWRSGWPHTVQSRRAQLLACRWQHMVLPSACANAADVGAPLDPQDRGAQPGARHRDEAAAHRTGRRGAPALAASALAARVWRRGALRLAPRHRQQERGPRPRWLAAARSTGQRHAAARPHVQHVPLRMAAGVRLAGSRAAATHAHRCGCPEWAAAIAHKRGEWCAECWSWC